MASKKKAPSLRKELSKGKPQFIQYRDPQNGLYYFRFVDVEGKTILTSKRGYASSKSRDTGKMHTINDLANYEVFKEGSAYYFIIKSPGNNAELARSKDYPSQADAKEAVALIIAACKVPKTKKKIAKKESGKGKTTAVSELNIPNPPRYTFRLNFYQSGDGGEMNGNIEYPLDHKKANFKGLDIKTIKAFLEENLPKQSGSEEKYSLPKPVSLKMEFMDKGKPMTSNSINGKDSFEIQIKLPQKGIKIDRQDYEAFVFAESLQTEQRVLIGQQKGFLPDRKQINFPLWAGSLSPGPYRMMSLLNWQSKTGEIQDSSLSESRYVVVY